jgi:hypothetical protein
MAGAEDLGFEPVDDLGFEPAPAPTPRPEPDLSSTKSLLQDGLAKAYGPKPPAEINTDIQGPAPAPTEAPAQDAAPAGEKSGAKAPEQPKQASTFLEALEAGWQGSFLGLGLRDKGADVILPEQAPMFYRIASNVSFLAGDAPAMLAGALAGAAAGGAAAGPPGAAVGSGAGAFALPAAMRKVLTEHYEKGDIQTFSDFWERSSAVFLETMKAGVVGAATVGVGGVVGKVLAPVASPLVKTTAQLSSEVATMVTVGAALEGHAPNAQDFVDAAVLVGGLRVAGKAPELSSKLRKIYSETGLKPDQVAKQAKLDPVLQQELLAVNRDMPEQYKALIDPQAQPKTLTPNEKVRAQIGEKVGAPKEKTTFNSLYKDYVDQFDPIKRREAERAKGATTPASEDSYKLTRMANDAGAKAKHFFEFGTLDYKTLEKTGKSLKEIVTPHIEEMPAFEEYLVAKRNIEIEGRGLKSGGDLAASSEVVKIGKAKFEKAAQEVVEFQNGVLKYARDAGLISSESMNSMVELGKSYIPFSRIIELEGGGTKAGKASSLKRLKGSDSKIQSPLLSILENTGSLLERAEKNRAMDAFVTAELNAKEGSLLEKVKTPQVAIEVKSQEIQRLLSEHGIDANPEGMTVFRSTFKDLAPDEIAVYRKGKREIYKTDPEIAESLKAMEGSPASQSVFMKLARGITTVKKIGISLTPDFQLRNFIRDFVTAKVNTKGGKFPIADVIFAMKDITGKTEAYANWLKSGGAGGAFLKFDEAYLSKDFFKVAKETGFTDRAFNIIKDPKGTLVAMGGLIENATRLAEHKRVSGKASSGNALFEGGFASREITVDFQRMGAKISALNQITAFLNVSVQGLDRTVRVMKENPGESALRAAAWITTPSVLLWWANKDDPRYRGLPQWERDIYWHIMTDDTIFRIPKPQELGLIFGSLPERVLENFFSDNPRAMKDFEDTMLERITPSLVPDAISPLLEQYFNKSFFSGGPLIPHKYEGMLPELQYTEYTSELSKALGKMILAVPGARRAGLGSPAVLDNYIQAWTGTLGKYAVQLADKVLTGSGLVDAPVKPAATLADIPIIKAFVTRWPQAKAQHIVDFQDRYREKEQVFSSIQELMKRGDMAKAQALFNEFGPDGIVRLKGINDVLANQNLLIQKIMRMDLPRDEKRQQIDGIYYGMIEISKQGNQLMDSLEKALAK